MNNKICDFYRNYYHRVENDGLNNVLNLYDINAKCTFNNENSCTPYNFLLKLTSQNVHKLKYNNIGVSGYINMNNIILNIVSQVIPINFFGYRGNMSHVSETFILANNGFNLVITDHIFKILS